MGCVRRTPQSLEEVGEEAGRTRVGLGNLLEIGGDEGEARHAAAQDGGGHAALEVERGGQRHG